MTEPTEGTGAMAERAVALLAENGYALLEAQDIVRWLREDGLLAALPRPTAPRREDVEKAIDAFRLACVARGALGRTDGIEAEMDATGAALLALYDAALTGAPEEVSEDDLCEDCLTQKATEFFETVPNQRCKDCTIKMLDEMCERLQAEKPTPVDDPQAKGRIAAILRDRDLRPITVTPLEAAERILKEICGPAARGAEGQAVAWDEGKVWSFCRKLIEQGRAIQQDDAAGKYPTYEHLAARVDDAARERAAEFVGTYAHPATRDAERQEEAHPTSPAVTAEALAWVRSHAEANTHPTIRARAAEILAALTAPQDATPSGEGTNG